MKTRFQMNIFLVMLGTATVLAFIVAFINFNRISDEVKKENQYHVDQIEQAIQDSITTIDIIYHYYETGLDEAMEKNTLELLEMYEEDPTFRSWDFEQLSEEFGMQVHVLDEKNTIIHSSFEKDIGMNFNECCSGFAKLLDERRESGDIYIDGLDISQSTGNVMKYSYMGTPDDKYLIELGVELGDDELYQAFNFFDTIENLKEQYPHVNNIHVLNTGGLAYGIPKDEWEFDGKRQNAFQEVLETGERISLTMDWKGQPATYHYVLLDSEYDDGSTQYKVIEIIYNNERLEAAIVENRRTLIIQMSGVFLIAIALTFLISRWTAQPIYLALHDRLTGLKNRMAFEERLTKELRGKNKVALFMFDLDNFKKVNDEFGHYQGDGLLQEVARDIQSFLPKKAEVYRFGGDEFAIIMPFQDKEVVYAFANQLMEKVTYPIHENANNESFSVTVSMGICFAPEHGEDIETLYKHADIALYAAKKAGKNQYNVFSEKDIE